MSQPKARSVNLEYKNYYYYFMWNCGTVSLNWKNKSLLDFKTKALSNRKRKKKSAVVNKQCNSQRFHIDI